MQKFVAKEQGKITKILSGKISYGVVMSALKKKDVKVNGKRVNKDLTVNVADVIEIYYTQKPTTPKYEKVFEDDNLLVVDKDGGITSEELFDILKEEYPTLRFIHRLDRNTTGIIIFAKNEVSENQLLFGFKNRAFEKKYRARVFGKPKKQNETLTAYLFKDAKKSQVFVYDSERKLTVKIITEYTFIKDYGDGTSLLEVNLITGKTHQIRAHLAFVDLPIVGDGKYGKNAVNDKYKVNRQQLTASSLTLKFDKDSPLYYANGKTFYAKERF